MDSIRYLQYQLQHRRLEDFAEWLISLDDDDPESPGRQERRTITLTEIINRAKEALDG